MLSFFFLSASWPGVTKRVLLCKPSRKIFRPLHQEKNFSKNFPKVLDNRAQVWYNVSVERETKQASQQKKPLDKIQEV